MHKASIKIRASSLRKPATAAAAEDMQVLLLKLGSRSFGVPLEHVRYVAQLRPDFAYCGAEAEDHFVFEGNPLTYVSLWDELGLKSAYTEYEEMQITLPQRRQDHIDWMVALENSIQTSSAFTKARNPHECAFGKWFYSYHTKNHHLSLLLRQFESPHDRIHALADKLLRLTEAGHHQEALHAFEEEKNTTLATLLRLFEDVQKLIVKLQRRTAVIVADGDDICALGTDGVNGIVSVPTEHIKHNAGKVLGADKNATSALILLDDSTVIPLLNWHNYCGSNERGLTQTATVT